MGLIQTIKTRGLLWVAVHAGLWLFDRNFEYVWYPWMILKTGLFTGTGIMMLASFLVCLGLVKFYDWLSTINVENLESAFQRRLVCTFADALGFETLKDVMASATSALINPEPPRLWVRPQWHKSWYVSLVRTPKHQVERVVSFIGSRMLSLISVTVSVVCLALYPVRGILYLVRSLVVRPLWIQFPWIHRTLLFLYLTLVFDPMACVILMRKKHDHRMKRKEWGIFLGSVFLSNASWGILVWVGVETFTSLFPILWEKLL